MCSKVQNTVSHDKLFFHVNAIGESKKLLMQNSQNKEFCTGKTIRPVFGFSSTNRINVDKKYNNNVRNKNKIRFGGSLNIRNIIVAGLDLDAGRCL